VLLSMVVAAAENGVIGQGNALPWHLPDDLKYFKALTLGKPVIMGRRTHESIGRPLPGRVNLVVSRQPGLSIAGCCVVDSMAAALAAAGSVPEAVLIGGAQLYREALPAVDRIHLTRVHARVPGDAFLPELPAAQWRETVVARHAADERHAHAFTFVTLERLRSQDPA